MIQLQCQSNQSQEQTQGVFFPSHRWDGATAQIKKGSGSGNIKNILNHLRAGMISDFSSKISHQSELSPEQAERRE